jgi:3-phenylpropionate/trans-cinnamate dioxygenase ferredoxin subunit
MGGFVRACAVEDVPVDGAVGLELDGLPVAVVNADGEFFAIYDVCSHAEVPLSEGDVDGCTIECWLHGSRFDLRSGKPTGLPAVVPVPVYPVRVEDGSVLVQIDPDGGPAGTGSTDSSSPHTQEFAP